jgi:hypothetical protein
MIITKKNRTEIIEEYDFAIGDRKGWEIIYTTFRYPLDQEKPETVRESLLLQERYPNNFPSQMRPGDTGYFNDVIFLQSNGTISRKSDVRGYSPAIKGFKELSPEIREEILQALSNEARALLTKGLESYISQK